MKTSYFANRRVTHPVSISGKAPDWYVGPQFKVLAPKYDFFIAYNNGELSEIGYTEQYITRVLDHLDPRETFQRLITLGGGDATLLCYEKPNEFCHRRLVAIWLEHSLNIMIPELS